MPSFHANWTVINHFGGWNWLLYRTLRGLVWCKKYALVAEHHISPTLIGDNICMTWRRNSKNLIDCLSWAQWPIISKSGKINKHPVPHSIATTTAHTYSNPTTMLIWHVNLYPHQSLLISHSDKSSCKKFTSVTSFDPQPSKLQLCLSVNCLVSLENFQNAILIGLFKTHFNRIDWGRVRVLLYGVVWHA